MNIYPAIDIQGGHCVRLRQGLANESTRYFEDPAEPAKAFADAGSAWIHVVDLDGAFEGAPKNLAALERIAATGLKVEFGGGLRTAENVRAVLDAGAARAIVGTKAAHDDAFVAELVARFGGEKIAVGIDAKNGFVAVKGWVDVTTRRATELAGTAARLGVSTIIYTDIATDGMLKGPNFSALEEMLRSTSANVVASGGVSRREDVVRLRGLAETYANLDGAIVGKAIYEKRVDLRDLLEIAR
ncbi:1-(5-phosphoribosyl)-5-[(5-phosphoribosylamino)methylideneamino]imidazole-4-carboxamide isomerase [Candidatus Spyradosoma sp. SGI.093]|uniref:1-(5-phosphoribosyl)-5-[(5- phosphoribosylamino)methylideneamino]imidazole-4- carboxamide isomerase n=1 Tax=Candidatus Spyradosoma sp. SGI.093 TaxID=3420583 RepID=UPI003D01C0E2